MEPGFQWVGYGPRSSRTTVAHAVFDRDTEHDRVMTWCGDTYNGTTLQPRPYARRCKTCSKKILASLTPPEEPIKLEFRVEVLVEPSQAEVVTQRLREAMGVQGTTGKMRKGVHGYEVFDTAAD